MKLTRAQFFTAILAALATALNLPPGTFDPSRATITKIGQLWQHPSGDTVFIGWNFDYRGKTELAGLSYTYFHNNRDRKLRLDRIGGWTIPELRRIAERRVA